MTTRTVTSQIAKETRATGRPLTLISWVMLKVRIAGSAPWVTMNAKTILEEIPAMRSAPSTQPTRASAEPSLQLRTWVANPLRRPE